MSKLGVANYEAHARTRTVSPYTQHGPDRKEQATSHSKVLRLCIRCYVIISVTKASMYLCRDRRRCADQSGGIYNSDSTVARDLWQRKHSGFALGLGSVYCHKSYYYIYFYITSGK